LGHNSAVSNKYGVQLQYRLSGFLIELQLLLLQESWKELFLLHLAQWSIPWDLSALFGCSKARDRLPQDDITNNEIKTIQVINPTDAQNA